MRRSRETGASSKQKRGNSLDDNRQVGSECGAAVQDASTRDADIQDAPPCTDAGDNTETGHAVAGDAVTFRLLHTSKDGKVCFFQDREGRITAVNAARLI